MCAREPSRLTPGISLSPLRPEAISIYSFGEYAVGVVAEPQERLAPQQPREMEVFVLDGPRNGVSLGWSGARERRARAPFHLLCAHRNNDIYSGMNILVGQHGQTERSKN